MARGGTAESIAKVLGVAKTTAFRRMQELKSGVPAMRAARRRSRVPVPVPLPEDAEEVPEDTPLEQIRAWLRMAKDEADAARAAGETEMMAKMLRLASTLLALQQKATPIAPPDPNEHPDMVAAAVRVRVRWHTLISAMAEKRST